MTHTYDQAAYTRGWRSSLSGSGGSALDRADARGEPDEWYDGYLDAAAGRKKWHLRDCTNHTTAHDKREGRGGCGEA